MIEYHLSEFELPALDFLFIENVGNLVCPSSYDLGEATRVVLLSVTEGEDKPLKYPTIFNSADVAVITKMDLAVPCDFDAAAAHASIQSVRPGMEILEVSSKSGVGMPQWLAHLHDGRHRANTAGTPA
jgi:hydrogenase nickel incorporation protein HypB